MENENILFDDGIHKCISFHFDDENMCESFLGVNQYLIIHKNKAILLDPGSKDMFDVLVEAINRHISIDKLEYIFFSHQDPDVADSIASCAVATPAKLLLPSIWTRFMSHYGLLDMSRILPLYDKGVSIDLEDTSLEIIPAHFLHSPGNFSLYDAYAKILFSGDIGASISPFYSQQKYVEDFERMQPFLEEFHTRYMAGNIFCKAWVESVRGYDIEFIAPQHGNIFNKQTSQEFLAWFETLRCGGDLIEKWY
ncbi:MAG: MBL fold metallo-hydrolase [Sulfurospirillum sp.]|nr:MBL fold metallo-hydrolase [Sulfurospirillum sp.]